MSRSLHKSLQSMCLQQALEAGHEADGERMMGGLVSGRVTGPDRKLETETRRRGGGGEEGER